MDKHEHRAFTVAEARRAGLSAGRLRNPALARPFHGVRVAGEFDADDLLARATALTTRLKPRTFFAHQTAAVLHGMPLPRRLTLPAADLHICVFAPERAPQLHGVHSHELKPVGHRIVRVHGLPALGPEDTWCQLSASLTVTELVVAADWLITGSEPYSGEPPLTTLDGLDRAIARRGRMRGVRSLRTARDRARYGSLSPRETRMRLLLADSGLPEPELNHRILDEAGALIAMVDLAYPERRIAIKYLGDHHRATPAAFRDDILRRERLAAHGWSALFTTAADLDSPAFFLVRLRRLLASTGKTS